jgi:hypothetical protein
VDEAETDGFGKARQQVQVAAGVGLIRGELASSVAKEPNSSRLLRLNSAARAGKCSRSTVNTSARFEQDGATEAVMAAAWLMAQS